MHGAARNNQGRNLPHPTHHNGSNTHQGAPDNFTSAQKNINSGI